MERIKGFLEYFGRVALLAKKAFVFMLKGKKRPKQVFSQFLSLGVDSLAIISLVSFFIGIIIAFQTAYQLRRVSSEIYIASLIALSITRELGPVITSLIIAGRSGAAITAQIGSMKVTEQIDALKSLSTDPVDYLVVPRLLALVIALPLLVIYADFVGILGGFMVASSKLNISWGMYFRKVFEAVAFKDIITGLFKAMVFGGIIGIICCYRGFTTFSGAKGVGHSVTKAVVESFILILTADCILTALFYVF